MMPNTLYYGDNLQVMREHIADQSVDLVYLDPPFNSNASYNVLFREKSGEDSPAQIRAFNDTWHWTQEAERTFESEILLNPNTPTAVKDMMAAFRQFLGRSDLLAYLVMMTPRLVELRRVLKPTGSLYLHCDSTAGHYLRLLLDSTFGKERFRREIIWKRTASHNNVRRNYGATADTVLFYTKSDDYTFNTQYLPYSEEQAVRDYKFVDADGRRYSTSNLRSPAPRPNLTYEYKGYQPHRNGWAVSLERMEQLDAEGRLIFPENPDGRIRLKLYLDEMPGVPLENVWTDIPPIGSRARERLGYPTQKPQALLERIITTSSNPGDVVLDPFCGCGTAVAAAENLGRQWLGIDITHLAVALMKSRIKTGSVTFCWGGFLTAPRHYRLIFQHPPPGCLNRRGVNIRPDKIAAQRQGGDCRCAAANKRVNDKFAGLGEFPAKVQYARFHLRPLMIASVFGFPAPATYPISLNLQLRFHPRFVVPEDGFPV